MSGMGSLNHWDGRRVTPDAGVETCFSPMSFLDASGPYLARFPHVPNARTVYALAGSHRTIKDSLRKIQQSGES